MWSIKKKNSSEGMYELSCQVHTKKLPSYVFGKSGVFLDACHYYNITQCLQCRHDRPSSTVGQVEKEDVKESEHEPRRGSETGSGSEPGSRSEGEKQSTVYLA